jgi:hypothetical protein
MTKRFNVPLGLVALASDPASGAEGNIYYNTTSDVVRVYANGAWANISAIASNGLPVGGTTGQILAKIDATDYNTEWIENYTETTKTYVKAAEGITKGQAVYISGANGTNVLVSKASNATEATSSKTLGLIASTVSTNGFAFVITAGLLAGLDTSTATAGDPVWLGTSGNLIYGLANKPVAPAHLVYIGVVARSNNSNGEILVRPQNGYELEELHNVLISGLADNEVLAYDSASSLWTNQTAAEAGLISGVGTTKVSYQTTAPSSPVTGDIWIDSDATTTEISPSLYSGYTSGEYYGIKNKI